MVNCNPSTLTLSLPPPPSPASPTLFFFPFLFVVSFFFPSTKQNDVKSLSVAITFPGNVSHQSCCQTGKQWQVAHISPARAKWASKWDKAERRKWHMRRWQLFTPGNNGFDRCPACCGRCRPGEEKKWRKKKEGTRGKKKKKEKRCVIIHTISSRCKKRPGAFASRGTSAGSVNSPPPPFPKKKKKLSTFHQEASGRRKEKPSFDTWRTQLLGPEAVLVHTRCPTEDG